MANLKIYCQMSSKKHIERRYFYEFIAESAIYPMVFIKIRSAIYCHDGVYVAVYNCGRHFCLPLCRQQCTLRDKYRLSGSQYRHCFCDHACHRRQRNYQPLSRRRSSAKIQCLFDAICRHCPWIGRSHFHFGSDICHAALSVFGSQ